MELVAGDGRLLPDLPVVGLHLLLELGNVFGVEQLVGGRVLRHRNVFNALAEEAGGRAGRRLTLPSCVSLREKESMKA